MFSFHSLHSTEEKMKELNTEEIQEVSGGGIGSVLYKNH
jgi:hypothetical protein